MLNYLNDEVFMPKPLVAYQSKGPIHPKQMDQSWLLIWENTGPSSPAPPPIHFITLATCWEQ